MNLGYLKKYVDFVPSFRNRVELGYMFLFNFFISSCIIKIKFIQLDKSPCQIIPTINYGKQRTMMWKNCTHWIMQFKQM